MRIRHGQRETIGAAVLLAISACGADETPAHAMRACFYQPGDLELIQSELRTGSVPHAIDGQCIVVAAKYLAELEAAQSASFGMPPPPGLNIAVEHPNETVQRLALAGVSARAISFRGRNVVIWDEEDALRAEEALGLSTQMREGMRRAREGLLPIPAE